MPAVVYRNNGIAVVRYLESNIGIKPLFAHVPMTNGEVQGTRDFELDGVTFSCPRKYRFEFSIQPMGMGPMGDGGRRPMFDR